MDATIFIGDSFKAEVKGTACEVSELLFSLGARDQNDGHHETGNGSMPSLTISTPTPAKKKMDRPPKKGKLTRERWTPEQDAKLISSHKAGATFREIAELVGRSEASVKIRTIRLRNMGKI